MHHKFEKLYCLDINIIQFLSSQYAEFVNEVVKNLVFSTNPSFAGYISTLTRWWRCDVFQRVGTRDSALGRFLLADFRCVHSLDGLIYGFTRSVKQSLQFLYVNAIRTDMNTMLKVEWTRNDLNPLVFMLLLRFFAHFWLHTRRR